MPRRAVFRVHERLGAMVKRHKPHMNEPSFLNRSGGGGAQN
jgi:hypothetical protein